MILLLEWTLEKVPPANRGTHIGSVVCGREKLGACLGVHGVGWKSAWTGTGASGMLQSSHQKPASRKDLKKQCLKKVKRRIRFITECHL